MKPKVSAYITIISLEFFKYIVQNQQSDYGHFARPLLVVLKARSIPSLAAVEWYNMEPAPLKYGRDNFKKLIYIHLRPEISCLS